MNRLIVAGVLALTMFLASIAYAETTVPPIGDPYTDTLQLWTSIAWSIEYIAQEAAAATQDAASTLQTLASSLPYLQGQPDKPSGSVAAANTKQSSLAAAVASLEAPAIAASTSAKPATQQSVASSGSTTSEPVIERVVQYEPLASQDFVTEPELTAQLQQFSNSLSSEINAAQFLTVPAWAPSQAINNLSNVTITNANLTASEIPALGYLSLNGGTLTGTLSVPTLNASSTNYGVITTTNASSTNFSNVGAAYFGGTATSSFDSAGDLIVAGDSTLTNATSTNFYATTASTTNLFATAANFGSAVINSLTSAAATITNLIATTITGTNLTVTNATSTNATTTNLYVSNSATIGSLTGFLKAIGGVIGTSTVNLASDVGGILPLGSGGTGTTTATGVTSNIQFLVSTSTGVARSLQNKLSDTISVKDFGATGNALSYSDGTISANTNTFSSNSATFTAGDVGKTIWIDYAGTSGTPLQTTIIGYTNAHDVTLGANAITSVPYSFLYGVFVATAQSGSGSYAPEDTITLAGGTASVPAVLTVERTEVTQISLASGGTGGTTTTGASSGSCVVTGTTGSGERKFSVNVTLTSGVITSIGTFTNDGQYSANPTLLSAEPVTGCGSLSGATVILTMGVLLAHVSTTGTYSAEASTLTQSSTSGSGTGATFTANFVTGGAFTYGTDDTIAWTNAINYVAALDKIGTPLCLYAPGGIYLITAALPTFYHAAGCVEGDGPQQTFIYAAPSLSGDVFSWSEDWGGTNSAYSYGAPSPLLSSQGSGPVLTNLHIVGDQSSTNSQNAITFYDRDDNVEIENVFVDYMPGSCMRTGVTKNVTTQAYIRESYIENLHCFNSGNATHPAIDILSTNLTSGDATNEVTFQDINVYAPNGPGFVLHSNGASALRLINVNNLRVEGQANDTGLFVGNLVQVGDSTLSGLVDTISFNQLQLISPYLGYAAFDVTADSSADQPYYINVNNAETSGGALGQGLRIEAGRSSSFSFQGIGTNGYNVYVGAAPLVGSGITVSDNGNEGSLYTSIDPSSVAFVRTPSGQTLASLSSYNTSLGNAALSANTTGSGNTAFGYDALTTNTTGANLTVFGYLAGTSVTNATADTLVGAHSGFLNSTGFGNTCIGYNTCYSNAQGNENTVIGTDEGYNLLTGSGYNILIGFGSNNSSVYPTTAKDSIEIGDQLNVLSNSAYAQLDIGNLLFGTGLASTTHVSAGDIAIGTSTPYGRLEIWGTDTASTSAFLIANSASTTEFNVLDNGNATLSGTLTQNSDQRLKTNIQSLDASSSLSLIDELNPVTFNWIDPDKGTAPQLGFIAQQVLPIFPNLVSTTSATALTPDGTLSLNYIDLISPIVSAIQALSSELSSIENTIAGFADGFTTTDLTYTRATGVDLTLSEELCIDQSDGTPVCVTGDQLAAVLAAASASQSSGQENNSGADDGSSSDSATSTPPQILINGDNPAIVQVGGTYSDLGATITGPQADLNLGITTYVNGVETSPVEIDTSEVATDTIDYVATGQNGLTSTTTRTVLVEAPSIVPSNDASTTATTSASTTATQ